MNTGLNLRLIISYKAIPNYTGKKYIISLEATEAKEISNVNAGKSIRDVDKTVSVGYK